MADFQDISGIYPDDTIAQLDLKRRLARADALRNQPMPQGQMVDGRYVAPSWTQYLSNVVGNYYGGKQEEEAMKQYGQYQTEKAKKYADLLGESDKAKFQAGLAQLPEFQQDLVKAKLSSFAPKKPIELGANAKLLNPDTFETVASNIVEKPETLTTLGKLQNERENIFRVNPNDPRIAQIDAAIKKETTFAPSPSMTVNMPRVETSARISANEDFTKNVYRPTLDTAKKNVNTLAQLDVLDKLPIDTGWGKETQAKAANVLVGLGYSGEEAKQLASNAQVFNAIRGKQTWEMLAAQKGPQTEGDAQRAQATYAQLGNTPQANKFINAFQRAVIKRQQAEARFYNQNYNKALQAGDLSQLERDWMDTPEAQKSIFDMPELKPWAAISGGSMSQPTPTKRWNPKLNNGRGGMEAY